MGGIWFWQVGNWDPATKSMRPLDEQDEEDSREIAGGSTEEEEEEDDKDMDEAEGGPDNKTIAGARFVQQGYRLRVHRLAECCGGHHLRPS